VDNGFVHQAVRGLRRDPGVSLVAILTFASAIGASIVAFGFAAAFFPARRAASTNASEALRAE
jgi:hypothetical protein